MLAALRVEARSVVIDLNKLSSVTGREALAIAEFVHELRAERGDYLSDVISLRSGDFETRASALGLEPRELQAKLRPAVRRARQKPARPEIK